MYSTAIRLSAFGIVLSAINIFCVAPILMFLKSIKTLPWAYFFAISIVMITAALALLMISIALRGAAQDMNMNDETYMTKITELKKRVDELENKVKM